MTTSSVVCSECGESSEVVEWGFILLARHGWSARLTDERSEPAWRCPACNERYSDAECWTIPVEPARRRPYVMSFYGLINWTHTWYRPDGPLSPEAFADLAADLFLDGFCRGVRSIE